MATDDMFGTSGGGSGAGDTLFTPDFSDTHDEIVLPADTEAKVVIKSASQRLDKNGNPFFMFGVGISDAAGHDAAYAKDFNHMVFLPNAKDDAKQKNRKNLRLRDFMIAFGLPLGSAFSLEQTIGLEAWVILGVDESEQYGDSNRIKRFIKAA